MGCQGCLAHPSSQPEWGVGRSGGSITPSPPGDRGSLEGASQWGRHSGRTPVLRTPTLRTLLEGHLARLGAEPPQGDLAASPTVPKSNTNPRGGRDRPSKYLRGKLGGSGEDAPEALVVWGGLWGKALVWLCCGSIPRLRMGLSAWGQALPEWGWGHPWWGQEPWGWGRNPQYGEDRTPGDRTSGWDGPPGWGGTPGDGGSTPKVGTTPPGWGQGPPWQENNPQEWGTDTLREGTGTPIVWMRSPGMVTGTSLVETGTPGVEMEPLEIGTGTPRGGDSTSRAGMGIIRVG